MTTFRMIRRAGLVALMASLAAAPALAQIGGIGGVGSAGAPGSGGGAGQPNISGAGTGLSSPNQAPGVAPLAGNTAGSAAPAPGVVAPGVPGMFGAQQPVTGVPSAPTPTPLFTLPRTHPH